MKNATRLITGLGAIAVIAVIALGWFLGVSPLLTQAAQSDADRATVEKQNDELQAELVILKAQFDNISQLEARLAMLNVLVPDEDPLDELYIAVNDCTVKVGATGIDTITSGDAVPYQVAAASDGIITTPGPTLQPRLFSVPVTIEVAGDPTMSANFIGCMQEDWPRVMAITTFQITAGPKPGVAITGYLFRVTDPAAIPGRLAAPFDDGEGEESAETAGDESDAESEETPDPNATETPAP